MLFFGRNHTFCCKEHEDIVVLSAKEQAELTLDALSVWQSVRGVILFYFILF